MTLQAGTYDVTAEATNYLSNTILAVPILTSTATTLDIYLEGSELVFSPPSIQEIMLIGDIVTNTMTISNSGPLPIDWSVSLANFSGPDAMFRNPTTIPASDGLFPMGVAQTSLGRPPADITGNSEFVLSSPIFAPGAPAFGIDLSSETLVSFDLDDPTILATVGPAAGDFFAGDFLSGDYSTLYAIDDASNTLYAIDTATSALTNIGLSTPPAIVLITRSIHWMWDRAQRHPLARRLDTV
jgi:hypothetical protein